MVDDNSPRNFGDTVSGIWLLINRWNPFSSSRKIPAITEIYEAAVKMLGKLEEDCKLAAILDGLAETRNLDKKKGTSARRNSI